MKAVRLLVVIALFSSLAFAAKKPARPTVVDPNDEKSGGPFLVNTPEGPVLQFPIIHVHVGSRCYGYLEVGEKVVRFNVTSGDKDHSFLYARNEITAHKSHELVTLMLPRGKFDIVPITKHFLESHGNVFATRANMRDPQRVLDALDNFNYAISAYRNAGLVKNETQQPPADNKTNSLDSDIVAPR